MSTIEISEGGVKIPTWAVGVVMTLGIGWMAWMSGAIVSTKTEIVELRAQVHSTAVPEGTEKALQELRSRMNAELAGRDTIAKMATENAVNISYLIREVETLKTRKP